MSHRHVIFLCFSQTLPQNCLLSIPTHFADEKLKFVPYVSWTSLLWATQSIRLLKARLVKELLINDTLNLQ